MLYAVLENKIQVCEKYPQFRKMQKKFTEYKKAVILSSAWGYLVFYRAYM